VNQAAIDWAWAQPVANNPGARMALLCLARRVNELWECTASQEEVAVDAMVPARSMRRYLEALEEGGWVARQRRMSDTGSRLPDRYRLNPAGPLPANLDGRQVGEGEPYRPIWPLANLATGSDQQEDLAANMASGEEPPANMDGGSGQGEPETSRSEPLANMDARGALPANMATGETAKPQVGTSGQIGLAIGVSSSSSKEEEQNLSTTKGGAGGKSADADEHPRFAEWYAAYPIHKAPAAARKAFAKAITKVDDIAVLVDAALRYRTDPQVLRGYGKHPATWLNGECWLDEAAPAQDATGTDGSSQQGLPRPLPPRVGGYENARNFGRRKRA
jgi:hypothetical protein